MKEIDDSEQDKDLIDSLLDMAVDKLKQCEQATGKLRGELMDKQKRLKDAKDRVSRNVTEKGSLDYQVRKCQAELKGIQLRQHNISNSGSLNSSTGFGGPSQSVTGGLFKQTTRYTIVQPDKGEPWNQPIEPMQVQKSAPSTAARIKKHTGALVPSRDPKDKGLTRWSCCARIEASVGCTDDTSAAAKAALVAFPADAYKPYSNSRQHQELRENVLAAHHDSIVLPVALNKGYVGGPVIGLRARPRAKTAAASRSGSGGGPGIGMMASQSLDGGSLFSSGIGGGHSHGHGHGHGQAAETHNPLSHLSHHSHAHAHTHLYQDLPVHLSRTFSREQGDTFVTDSSQPRPVTASAAGLARTSAKARALGTESFDASREPSRNSPMRTSELFVQKAMFDNSVDPRRALDGASQFLLARKSMDAVSRMSKPTGTGADADANADAGKTANTNASTGARGTIKGLRPGAKKKERYMMRADDEELEFGHRIAMVTQASVGYRPAKAYDAAVNTSVRGTGITGTGTGTGGVMGAGRTLPVRPSTASIARLSTPKASSSVPGAVAAASAPNPKTHRPNTASSHRHAPSAANHAPNPKTVRPGSASPGPVRPLTASTSGRGVGVLRESTDLSASIGRKQARPLTAHSGPHLYTSLTITPGACLTNINARIV